MSTPSWSSSYVSIQFVPHYIPSSLQQRSPGSTCNVIQPTKQIPTKEYLNCFTELSSSATPAEPLILTPYPFAITILYSSSHPQPLCIADLCCWLLGCLGCPSWIWCETLCPYFLCAIILVFVINSSPVLAAMTGIGNYLSFLILWLVVGGWTRLSQRMSTSERIEFSSRMRRIADFRQLPVANKNDYGETSSFPHHPFIAGLSSTHVIQFSAAHNNPRVHYNWNSNNLIPEMSSTSTHFNSRILEPFFDHLGAYEKCKTIISAVTFVVSLNVHWPGQVKWNQVILI